MSEYAVENPASADEARARAEARRRRILEKSNQRMSVVSGEHGKPPVPEDEGMSGVMTRTSSSNRLQAIRRRRYKKNQPQAHDNTSSSTSQEDKKNEIKDKETAKKDIGGNLADGTTVVSNEKRKYKGVAAMRRQKLKEKVAKENISGSATTEIAPQRNKAVISKFPIVLHIFTVFLLFSIGFKVGIDQVIEENTSVHANSLAPQQHGIGLLRILKKDSKSEKRPRNILIKESKWVNKEDIDEFDALFRGQEKVVYDDDNEYLPNLDPLFQLDLDLYTQGESALMMIARCAVYLHRINLNFFYYTPISFLKAFSRIPSKLIQTPPVLCLFAVGARQFLKRVLGAGLPEEAKESDKTDILGMLKNGVMNFLANSFPTFVQIYDIFAHLRADLFIILCGLFVGLARKHCKPESSDERYEL